MLVRCGDIDADANGPRRDETRSEDAEARRVNQWAFVFAAYAVATTFTTVLVLWAMAAMRRAETAADSLKRP